MFEKVNPHHPDKVADRIAGAIVDLAYTRADGGWLKSCPRIAVEVLIGHGNCYTIIETSLSRQELRCSDVDDIVHRIAGTDVESYVTIAEQDVNLSNNQRSGVRVGDNGVFRGCPLTDEQRRLVAIARSITEAHPSDGKYILNGKKVVICQSNMSADDAVACAANMTRQGLEPVINPLGEWTGGTTVDSGATNRKLGSDMGEAVTGGGLHGKDLSKADVSVNIACHMKAQASGVTVEACTAIGDKDVTFRYASGEEVTEAFADVVDKARLYILSQHGSFEHFAEWGLVI